MSDQANFIIDELGGTAAVARMTKNPTSTVHSWRKNGLSPSRLDHLRLAAKEEGLSWPLDIAEPVMSSPDSAPKNIGQAA
ncbi:MULTISPECIES: hypothetical protein [Sphingobium]|jgi:hypothetical protein|uniref:carph-isopro domain-containing protein n=1 Tax=Sphingobium TaxID=165695 RepID=UPI0013DDD3A1|nr:MULTISPECIES: hypothetical protein [Sphingobium]